MKKRQVFYSFHFDNDVMRVQQIRNIGVLEGNKPVSPNKWIELKNQGDVAISRWIDENMRYKFCVIVLIGSDTANRKWIKYEIKKAWESGKGLLGIHIHNLKCPRTGVCMKGQNPFDQFTFKDGRRMSSIVKCYDPASFNAYGNISLNIDRWIQQAIKDSSNFKSIYANIY